MESVGFIFYSVTLFQNQAEYGSMRCQVYDAPEYMIRFIIFILDHEMLCVVLVYMNILQVKLQQVCCEEMVRF